MRKKPGRKPSKYKARFWEALPRSTDRPIGEILQAIDRLTKSAFAAIEQPQELYELSEAVAKLPAYMNGLGYYLADAEQAVSLAKDDLEYATLTQEKELIDDGKSVAEASRVAGTNDELILLKDKLRQAQHNYRVLKLKYDASNRQFEGWRSRLAVIKNDLQREQ